MAKEATPSRTRWYVLAGVAVVLIGVVAAYVATRGDNNTVPEGGRGGHDRSGRPGRHLPPDRRAGPGRGGARPSGPGREDRQLSR